ncbi:MAG: BrnT family toxin [Burkholderiaceae bacterium]
MSGIRFEWDPEKAQANLRKHGVSFDDARSVLSDEGALLIDDPDHSRGRGSLCPSRPERYASWSSFMPTGPTAGSSESSRRARRMRRVGPSTDGDLMHESTTTSATPGRTHYRSAQEARDDRHRRKLRSPTSRVAEETGIPYQSLINLYLKDCAASQKKLSLAWKSAPGGSANN